MLQSLEIRLETSKQENELLLETMKHYNSAANFIGNKAFELKSANKYRAAKIILQRDQRAVQLERAIRDPCHK